MDNVIESYLVSLGFQVDQPELAKFKRALKDAGDTAEKHTSGIIGQFVKWQGAIVGAFSAVGLATIGMMDKVADADLGFKLTAQRMFLSVDAARSLTIATKALGHSLEDIAWNPELHQRFTELWAEQKQLLGGSPADSEQTLQRIRDVRFEITKAQVALQYIARDVTVMLYKALGGDAFLVKLRGWVEWLVAHEPQISKWLTSVLVPILKDAGRVLQDVWKVVEKLAQAFVRLIGAFSGDKSLKDGALTFENVGKAIDKAADYMVRFVDAVTSAELVVIDLFNALVDLANFDLKSAWGDLKGAKGDLTEGGAGVLGTTILASIFGAKSIGGLLKLLARGGAAEGAGSAAAVGAEGFIGSAVLPLAVGAGAAHIMNKLGVAGWIDNALRRMGIDPTIGPNIFDGSGGVDPALVGAVARQESGGRQFDRNGNVITSKAGALGMMQLMPGTAARLGVNPNDAQQNLEGGTRLLGMLLKKYGNVQEALAAYNWGEGHLDAALRRHGGQFSLDYLPKETRDYVSSIEGRMGGGITVHNSVIVQGTNATPEQIKRASADGAEEGIRKATRKDLVNPQGVYA